MKNIRNYNVCLLYNMKWKSIVKKLKSCNLALPILLLFIIGIVIYNSCTKPQESFTNNNSNGKDCIIRFFYVDWCGHCKNAKPQFTQFMNQNNGKTIKGKMVTIEMINCESSDQNKKLASQFNVKGYPTIIAMINGKEVQYNGPRTTAGLDQWLNSIL